MNKLDTDKQISCWVQDTPYIYVETSQGIRRYYLPSRDTLVFPLENLTDINQKINKNSDINSPRLATRSRSESFVGRLKKNAFKGTSQKKIVDKKEVIYNPIPSIEDTMFPFHPPSECSLTFKDTFIGHSLDKQPIKYMYALDTDRAFSLIEEDHYRFKIPSDDGYNEMCVSQNCFLVYDSTKTKDFLREHQLRMNGEVLLFPSNFSFTIHNIRDYAKASKFESFYTHSILYNS